MDETWLSRTLAITTPQVHRFEEPVLLVLNDTNDNDKYWQLIGESDADKDGVVMHLYHAVEQDPTLAETLVLDQGLSASRHRIGGPWTDPRTNHCDLAVISGISGKRTMRVKTRGSHGRRPGSRSVPRPVLGR